MTEEIIKFKNTRNRTLENAKGYEEFSKQLQFFMQINNMCAAERRMVLHMLNCFYFTGFDIENGYITSDEAAMALLRNNGSRKSSKID
jgi:hypothetical protein